MQAQASADSLFILGRSPPTPFSCCKCCRGGRGCLRRKGSSPLPHLPWSPNLETCPPVRGTSPSELGWPLVLCGVGVGWGAGWPSVFSCLYERKLAVSQQTQEPSVARGRPLHQRAERGVWGGKVGKWSPLLPAEMFIFGLLQPFPLRMKMVTTINHYNADGNGYRLVGTDRYPRTCANIDLPTSVNPHNNP